MYIGSPSFYNQYVFREPYVKVVHSFHETNGIILSYILSHTICFILLFYKLFILT